MLCYPRYSSQSGAESLTFKLARAVDPIIFQFDERAILSCHATFATQARVERSFESPTILRLMTTDLVKRGYVRAWFELRLDREFRTCLDKIPLRQSVYSDDDR